VQTFTVSPDPFLKRYSRRTQRLATQLRQVGFEAGGRAGSRLVQMWHLSTCPSTLLRLVRQSHFDLPQTIHVLGLDDWAYRKGRRYGTLLADLETHCVVDVLPTADTQAVTDWLKTHPEVQLISRDRGRPYREAVQQGAPQAQVVADRWHLVHNLSEALVATLTPYTKLIRQTMVSEPLPETALPFPPRTQPPAQRLLRPLEQARLERREDWERIFDQVHTLHAAGMNKSRIARQLHIDRKTVRHYCRLTSLPKKTSPKFGPRVLDPYWDLIRQRVSENILTGRQIWREIKEHGFRGANRTVAEAVKTLRADLSPENVSLKIGRLLKSPTLRQLAAWILALSPTPQQQLFLNRITEAHPDLELALGLARDFLYLLRNHRPQHFRPWMDPVNLTSLKALNQFAQGLADDDAAVVAACTSPWSNGQVEG
jgi:transposase